jgi:STE24 endopeptidase
VSPGTLLAAFQTSVLLPLFNRLTPLDDGPLKQAIRAFVARTDFALDDVYVMDGSKRSAKANAFFSGLGRTRKVVLFDTPIEKHGVQGTGRRGGGGSLRVPP